MGYADESASGAPVEAYHVAASGAPVGAEPMALIERPPAGVVSLRAPGYHPVTLAPAPASARRKASKAPRGQAWLVAVIVALALIGAVLAGITWR